MSKIAIITDTHYGVRSDNISFHNYTKKFLDDVFFPYIDEHDIKTILHLGDITDRRKFINFYTSKRLHDDFIQPILDRNLNFIITLGNHDVYYKNTNDINSMNEIYGKNGSGLTILSEPQEMNIEGLDMLLMPWICPSTFDKSLELLENTKCQMLMGHLEIKGFEMYRGHVSDHGFTMNLFDKFDVVCSGHYHHKSSYGNINYLGSHAQFTWSDYGDERGFHVLDTTTRELEFIKNPYEMFHKIFYDDNQDILNEDFGKFENTYVKVIISKKENSFLFDSFIDKLEKSNTLGIQIVDDNLHLDLLEADEIIDEAQDTLTILKKYVDNIDAPPELNKNDIKKFLHTLYLEALEVS